nr:hypothetical protein C09H10.4 - Caenorhabditis elegans [Caenorhabditis elegans]
MVGCLVVLLGAARKPARIFNLTPASASRYDSIHLCSLRTSLSCH